MKLLTQQTTLGYPPVAVRLVGGGLPVTQDWFEMGCHLSPSQNSIRLTDEPEIPFMPYLHPEEKERLTTNKQTIA